MEQVINQFISEPLSPAEQMHMGVASQQSEERAKAEVIGSIVQLRKLRIREFRQTLMTLQGGSGKAGT